MLGEKVWVATVLLVSPEAVAMTFSVTLESTRKGATYCGELVVGVLPSRV